MTDIIVPQLGESVTEATVGAWMVKTGDAVSKDDVLVELETDKVAVEVRAEVDGVRCVPQRVRGRRGREAEVPERTRSDAASIIFGSTASSRPYCTLMPWVAA